MRKRQTGFTLIEIAIVMVIIGLLLGGVLKGQEMIVNSRVRNTISNLDGIAAAIYSYQDRYQALPGDDSAAAARWGAGLLSGDGDGLIEGPWTATDATADESAAMWEHLRHAGLIKGGPTIGANPVVLPIHPFGGTFGVESVDAGNATASGDTGIATGAMICMTNIEADIGEILDRNLDDGNGTLGDVQNENLAGGGGGDAVYDVINGDLYTVCRRL